MVSNDYLEYDASVIFADISGFTAIAEKMDPEDVTSILNDFFEIMCNIVYQYGGIVDRFIGDCLVAIFKETSAECNFSLSSVDCSVALMQAIHQHLHENRLLGALDLHIGVSRGSLIETEIKGLHNSGKITMGDAVIKASKLQSFSPGGSIYVCERIYKNTKHRYEYNKINLPSHPQETTTAYEPVLHVTELKDSSESVPLDLFFPTDRLPLSESERRQVTILFAEISGLNDIPPSSSLDIINRYFPSIEKIVNSYEGHLNEIVGNQVMAAFGAPIAIEDAPQKAINAAIEIRNLFNSSSENGNLSLISQFHIGIHFGISVTGMVGSVAKHHYGIVGDTVNIASRLQATADYGQILVSDSIQRMTSYQFEFRETKPLKLKGKSNPVQTYELLSEKEKRYRSAPGKTRSVLSEFVGRQEELILLKKAYSNLESGKGSIVAVVGEAGIGKSRLIAEFLTATSIEGSTILKGRSLSFGQNLSFHPIVDLLKNWAEIKDEDDVSKSIRKIEKAVHALFPEEGIDILPFILKLSGIQLREDHARQLEGIKGESLEKLLGKHFRDFIAKISSHSPTIVIFEDLHWADQSSIEMIEMLFRLSEEHRVQIINVFRPHYSETTDRILNTLQESYENQYTKIQLETLDEEESAVLIKQLIDSEDFPLSVQEKIIKTAEGNPFFIEEVVRSFFDENFIKVVNGKIVVSDNINMAVIPVSVNEVLMVRIDKLDLQKRELLKVASVIGRYFLVKILANVIERAREIENTLNTLQILQFIQKNWQSPELQYFFKHALIQEVTYQSIIRQKRRELHLKVATSIESLFINRLSEFYGLLAFHYEKAEHLAKAEEYMFKAGQEALASAASSEALYYFRGGLNIYLQRAGAHADRKTIIMFEKNIAISLFQRGIYAEAGEYFEKILSFYGFNLPQKTIPLNVKFLRSAIKLHLLLYLKKFYIIPKKPPSEIDIEVFLLLQKRGATLTAVDPKRAFIESFFIMDHLTKMDYSKIHHLAISYFSGFSLIFNFAGIMTYLTKKVLSVVKNDVPDDDVECRIIYLTATENIKFYSGNWKESKFDELVFQAALKIGDFFMALMYVISVTFSRIEQGRYHDSVTLIAKIRSVGETFENDFAKTEAFRMNAYFLVKYRKIPEALDELEKGIHFIEKTGHKAYQFVMYSLMSRLMLITDRMVDAEKWLSLAGLMRSEAGPVPIYNGVFLIAQAVFSLNQLELRMKNGYSPEFVACKRRAWGNLKKLIKNAKKLPHDLIESYRLMGWYFWIIGRQSKAIGWWTRSVSEGKRLGALPELARSYFEMGKMLVDSRCKYSEIEGLSGGEYLEKARILFHELGLEWDLVELYKIRESFKISNG